MWRFRLIRFRLTLIYTLLLTGAFALFSVGIFVGLDHVLNNDFYNRLSDAADNVVKDSKITATWSGGELRQREDEWLSTGDLAEAEPTGELRFLGRKSDGEPGWLTIWRGLDKLQNCIRGAQAMPMRCG